MCRVKLFVNGLEPAEQEFVDKMDEAHIYFRSVPTSGPVTVWVDGYASHGPTAVRDTIQHLLDNPDAYSATPY